MKPKAKNSSLFMIYAICIGAITGLIIWCFLKIMNLSIHFIWETIPNMIEIPFYTILVCTIGGLSIGIWKKKHGNYPEELQDVIQKVKKDGRYPYKNIDTILVSAILPLIFGGSTGPEAGLTGVIAGLCTWVSDKFKSLFKEMQELTQIGISATLGTIFNSPIFGFIEPLESEEETKLPKTSKIVLYFLAIFGAFGIFILLNHIFGGKMGMPSFGNFKMNSKEWLWILPFSFAGIIAGLFYHYSHKIVIKMAGTVKSHTIIQCTLAGFLLGLIGTFLPYTMFSGEHQIEEVMKKWQELGIILLLSTAFIKILITNICVNMGFKGGHFFPCIFSGICLGYALSLLTNVDPIFSVIIVTTSFMAFLMNKPFATVLLLMILFPASAIPIMLLSAVIGSSLRTFSVK